MNNTDGYITSAADDAYIKYSDSPYTYYDGANDYDFRTNALGEILYGQAADNPAFISSTLFYQLQNTMILVFTVSAATTTISSVAR